MTPPKADRAKFFIYLYMAIVGAVLVALVGYGFYNRQVRASAFNHSGIEVTATYIGGRTLKVTRSSSRPPSYEYFGQVRFPVDGKMMMAEARVSAEFHRSVKPGNSIQIRYLPDAPETVQIDPIHETREYGFIWMIALFLAACLVYWLVRKWRKKRPIGADAKPVKMRPKIGKALPGWFRLFSVVMTLLAITSLFTISIKIRYAVEAATYQTIGWLSLPLAMIAMFVPPALIVVFNVIVLRRVVGKLSSETAEDTAQNGRDHP